MARQLTGMRDVPTGALVVGLDEDEYVVFDDPKMSLADLRREMLAQRVCALTLTCARSLSPKLPTARTLGA